MPFVREMQEPHRNVEMPLVREVQGDEANNMIHKWSERYS